MFAVYEESLRLFESAVPILKDATDIAKIFCRVLNQTPLDLPSFDTWSRRSLGVTTCSCTTRFTEPVTLFYWKNTIDLSDVDVTDYIPLDRNQMFKDVGNKTVKHSFIDLHQNSFSTQITLLAASIRIDTTLLDRTKAAGIVVPPRFLTLCDPSNASTYKIELGYSVFYYMQWRMFGHIGMLSQSATEYTSLRAEFQLASTSQFAFEAGLFNISKFF
jgi:hypothetical protein